MMADIESRLNIAITANGVDAAKKSLAELTKAGASAEKATDGLGKSSRQAGDEMERAGRDAQFLAKETEKIGLGAKQATFALRQVPAQFTDIVVSLQSGQAPLTVLLQQGGQLRDLFGGVGNAAQALGGYIAGLVTPLNLTIAATLGLAAATKSAFDEVTAFNVAINTTGKFAGSSATGLRQIAQDVGEVTRSYGTAKDAVLALAQTGQISARDLQKSTQIAVLANEYLGMSVEDVADTYAALAKEPLKALLKLNETMNFLTLEDYKRIKALQEQGRQQDAVTESFKLFEREVVAGSSNVEKSLSFIESEFKDIARGTGVALNAIKNFFAPLSDTQQLQKAKEQLQSYITVANSFPKGSLLGNAAQKDVERQQAVVNGLQAEIDARKRADQSRSDSALKQKQLIKEEQDAEKDRAKQREESLRLAEQERKQRERESLARATYLKGISDEIAALKAQDALIRQGVGAQEARTTVQLRANNVNEATIQSLISAQKEHDNLIETLKKEQSFYVEYEKSLEKQQQAIDNQIETVIKNAEAINSEVDNYGKLPSAITEVTIARKKDQAAIIEGLGLSTDDINREIEALEKLKSAQNRKEQAEAYRKAEEERVRLTQQANDKIQRDMEETSKTINKSLTDALLRGFESGKSFAENFRDTLINMFKTMVLQPAINFILSPISNAVAQSFAGQSNASISGSAGSIFNNLSNVFTTSNQSIISGIKSIGTTIANGMGSIRDSIGGFIVQNASTLANIASYGGAVLQLSQGNLAGAALTAVGTYFGGPLGGAIGGAIGGLFGSKKRTPIYSSGVRGSFVDGLFTSSDRSGFAFGNKDAGGQVAMADASKVFTTSLDKLFKAYGLNEQIKTSLQFYTRKGSWGAAQISIGGVKTRIDRNNTSSLYDKDASTAFNNLITAFLTKGFAQAVKSSTLPVGIKTLFDDMTDQTQIGNMLTAVISLGDNQDLLVDKYKLTASQAGKVAKASGLAGDELTAFLNSIIAAGVSGQTSGEQIVRFRDSLTEQLGMALPASLEAFDLALRSINKSTDAGVQAFSDLFSLRDEFIQFQSGIDSLKGGVKSSLLGIVSGEERQNMLQADLAELFDSLNVTLPTSINELIELGKSIDYTTAEGLTLASAFPSLVSAFTQANEVIAELTKTTDDFASNFEYLRYQALSKNYGQSYANKYVPSFDIGTNYVPSDGLAMIHQGERIIPAADNATLMQNSADMVAAIRELRSDVNTLNYTMQSAAVNAAKTAKSLDNIERGGVIISDIGIDGNEQVLKVEVVA